MNATLPRQTPIVSNLNLLHTQVGFDLLVDPADYIGALLVRDGIFEAAETDLVTRILRAGDTCIDAGCHVGYYSCLLAKLVGEKGRVYSFDANPQACHNTRRNLNLNGSYSAEVIQSALGNSDGMVPFHISTDDQTGLSSLGPIPRCKETISVPCLRLEAFLNERRVDSVRLLKVDVEGAEEMLLGGLGHFLADHVIDYILVECFDERLQLLGSSTEKVGGILKSAGYKPWEYGIDHPAGWSEATDLRSRGDCNYLFSSPAVTDKPTSVSLASALGLIQTQRGQLLSAKDELQYQKDRLQDQLNKLQDDVDWLLDSIKAHEEESARLAAEKGQLLAVLEAIQKSPGWRVLNPLRKMRNWLAPENTRRRNFYASIMRHLGGKG